MLNIKYLAHHCLLMDLIQHQTQSTSSTVITGTATLSCISLINTIRLSVERSAFYTDEQWLENVNCESLAIA